MSWNIPEFFALANKHLPSQLVSSLALPVNSIPWKFMLCRYHISESDRILSEQFTWDDGRRVPEAIGKMFMAATGGTEGLEFSRASFCAEAHVIAFAQALHSTADILAQILCISLNLDVKPDKRYLPVTANALPKDGTTSRVAAAASTLLDSAEFKYLRAYVNTTKHVSLVSSTYTVGLGSRQVRQGLKVTEFQYGSEHWPQKWISDFTGQDFEKLSTLFGAIGTELNEHLRSLPERKGT